MMVRNQGPAKERLASLGQALWKRVWVKAGSPASPPIERARGYLPLWTATLAADYHPPRESYLLGRLHRETSVKKRQQEASRLLARHRPHEPLWL
ncbi:MAG: hypothetical protein ACR2GU_05480 [Rubrobacteraceae bacterium]